MKPETFVVIDQLVLQAYESLCDGAEADAEQALRQGLQRFPHDSRFAVMAATLAHARGQGRLALGHLWAALAADPGSTLASDELRRLAITPLTDASSVAKDFSLHSGERQTADQVRRIRADHRARYALAARWLRQQGRTAWTRSGLDLFCGTGYGSYMLGQQAGVRMLGVDGSAEAVALATRAFGSHRVQFAQAVFPFALSPDLFDFAVSFESIEHVEDALGLLQQMAAATDGPFIISVPHEPGLPFDRFGSRFEHHVRHFHRHEILDLLAQAGRTRIVAEYGQQVYRVERGEMVGLMPEAQMGLHAFDRRRSQFLVLIAERG